MPWQVFGPVCSSVCGQGVFECQFDCTLSFLLLAPPPLTWAWTYCLIVAGCWTNVQILDTGTKNTGLLPSGICAHWHHSWACMILLCDYESFQVCWSCWLMTYLRSHLKLSRMVHPLRPILAQRVFVEVLPLSLPLLLPKPRDMRLPFHLFQMKNQPPSMLLTRRISHPKSMNSSTNWRKRVRTSRNSKTSWLSKDCDSTKYLLMLAQSLLHSSRLLYQQRPVFLFK